ncbi:MAG: CAP domain-containing protein [Hyphomicrobiaceae bacterium]
MPTILPDIPQVEQAIIEMTNTYRAGHKLGAVAPSPALTAAAKAFADYLARTDRFAHDADGRSHADRVAAAGYDYCEVSENLARSLDPKGFESRALARITVEGWLNSPGHRHNIEADNVTDIGVAVARVPDAHPKFVVVQLFGRPRTLAFDVQIANSTGGALTYLFGSERHQLPASMAATHTTCAPTRVTFPELADKARGPSDDDPNTYMARSEQVFVVTKARNGRPAVRVEPRRRIE